MTNKMRKFKSGSTRNPDKDKLDYDGFNSPIVDWAYAQYMHKNRLQEDGSYRDSDNWQKGGEEWTKELLKSLHRHHQDVRLINKGYIVKEKGEVLTEVDVLCGIIFNCKSKLHELLKNTKEVNRNYEDLKCEDNVITE